jgi:hypothetical protein
VHLLGVVFLKLEKRDHRLFADWNDPLLGFTFPLDAALTDLPVNVLQQPMYLFAPV